MKTPRMALVALVVGAALTACGGAGTPSPSEGSPVTSAPAPDPAESSTAPPTASAPAPPPTVSPTVRSPIKPSGPRLPPGVGAVEVSGTVTAGVEPGCLMLDGFQLLGGPRDVLTPGAKVTVTGKPQPDLLTTCQQGTPFTVESARRS
ncbi:hypothetical protein E1193_10175 [Micromonospora sp. KC606]|uniref:hypothetical protein n=1 Tax=Micromonospora sp. KC606 TaxID=2530379 RepID=UPI001048E2A5|nr:hypothetical protein [Micromonospora sp. KC606]TDC83021.1 hypothetical protein E1193_10175 [Micromonospora sp. KC606]